MCRIFYLSILIAAWAFLAEVSFAITVDQVPVGNPGNTGEISGAGAGGSGPDRICGAVSYIYDIGTYEITAGQYVAFLNAVAKTDAYNLYNVNMDTVVNSYGCNIKRTGLSGAYAYSVTGDWANRPVNYVSWGDAARFANWLANNQPTGAQGVATTEDGSYALKGMTSDADLLSVIRKANATWVIPTEDEWYKAAYHKNDGATGVYFDYPMGSSSIPSNALVKPDDPGNNATFWDPNNGFTIGSPCYRTEVGAHGNSDSPYHTFDQGGNVMEWNQTVVTDQFGSGRGLRGGAFLNTYANCAASDRSYFFSPSTEGMNIGFRTANIPPSIWKGPGGGTYDLPSNWTNNNVPVGADSAANFLENIIAASSVALSSDVTLGTINFDSLQSYSLTGESNLILKSSEGKAHISVLSGTHQISVPLQLQSDASITGPGTLDLSGGISGSHSLDVDIDLTATTIQVDTITLFAGATLTIQAMPGGPQVAVCSLETVPEPSAIIGLLGLGATSLAVALRRRLNY
jgi:formylglycine-generating enzyme